MLHMILIHSIYVSYIYNAYMHRYGESIEDLEEIHHVNENYVQRLIVI